MSAAAAPGEGERFAVRGRVLLGGEWVRGAVVVAGPRVAEVVREPGAGDLPARVLEAEYVSPGLIDLQVNGGFGHEVGDDAGALAALAARLPATGVTAFLPTLVSSPADLYPRAVAAFEAVRRSPGAQALGLHLEGPLLAARRAGAHAVDAIDGADAGAIDAIAATGAVRLVTLAPERAGARALISRLVARSVVVSLGHTDASYEDFVRGVDAGAAMATHLYNAMSPFGHRAPGAVGAALADDRVTAGLIADGVHCHPAALRVALRAKGTERVALVTDAMAGAGMPPGTYPLGGRQVTVDACSARLADGTLAGSVLTLDRAVRNAVEWAGVAPLDAIRMASEVPARVLGLRDRGRLRPGADADLVLWDADFGVLATLVAGELAYSRDAGSMEPAP